MGLDSQLHPKMMIIRMNEKLVLFSTLGRIKDIFLLTFVEDTNESHDGDQRCEKEEKRGR